MQSAARKFLDEELQYDELYGGRPPLEAPPAEQPKRRASVLNWASRVRLLLCAVMVIAVGSLIIYGNVAVVELGDRLNRQANTLQQLVEESEQLQARIDSSISLNVVAELAADRMLMGKEDSYQITYISLGNGDTVSSTAKSTDRISAQRVLDTLSKLKEYMENR